MLGLRVTVIDDNATTAIRDRLSEIQPGMGNDAVVFQPVLAKLTAWLTDGTERTFTSLAAATSAALRSMTIDTLLFAAPEHAAQMRALAEIETNRARYLTWSQGLAGIFGNCGRTAEYARTWLTDRYGAVLAPAGIQQVFALGAGAGLTAWLTTLPAAGEVHLLDCQWRNLHNFLVELHPDGTAYLAQGYQGAYSALWWETDAVVDQVNSMRVANREAIRTPWGGGRAINLVTLAGLLTNFVNVRSAANWLALPFDPVQQPPQTQLGNELICTRYTVTNSAAVYGTLGGASPQSLVRRALLTTRPPA